MESVKTTSESRTYEVRAWEFNLLFVELILLAALAVAWIWSLGPSFLGAGPPWANAALKGFGFFLLGLALYPVLSIQSRNSHGRELSLGLWIAGAFAASVGGAVLYFLLG